MGSKEKVANYVSKLDAQGIHPLTSAPLLYRVLWRIGIPATPPLNNSFAKNFALATPLFGISIGISIPLAGLPARVIELFGFYETIAACALTFGSMLGLMVAAYFALRRRGLVLPDWD